jgi:hypothetical protein
MATVNLGSIKFKWKGTYSGATAYTVDDVVEYNGSSYICKLASTGNLPTNTTYFDVMSQAGTDLTSTLTTQGDILYRDGSGLQRLGAGTSGEFLKTQGAGANPVWASAGGGLQSMQVFTSSGTYTKPSGINKIKVYVTGGGGGGSGNPGDDTDDLGNGGHAGGTAIKIIDATSITTETITIGGGGTAGANDATGGTGGTSSFGSHCSATGGEGGWAITGSNATTDGGNGSGGDINLRGGCGEGNWANFYANGLYHVGGMGGASFWGGGSHGGIKDDFSGSALHSDGFSNGAYGSGGGGSAQNTKVGGAGVGGVIVVEEYK